MIFSYNILKLSDNWSDCVRNMSIVPMRLGIIADRPGYHKSHVLSIKRIPDCSPRRRAAIFKNPEQVNSCNKDKKDNGP